MKFNVGRMGQWRTPSRPGGANGALNANWRTSKWAGREWRPLIASEVVLHGAKHSPVGRLPPLPVWKSLLEPLGYVPDGECPGLRFYRALASQLRQRDG